MKAEYSLVKSSARNNTDLRYYEKEILNAYKDVNPSLSVGVHDNSYVVSGNLTRGQAVRAGRIIAKSSLGSHAVKYPVNSKKPSTVQVFRRKKQCKFQ